MKDIPLYQKLGDWHEVHIRADNPCVYRRTTMSHAKGPYGTILNAEAVAWLDEHAPNGTYRFKQYSGHGVGVRFKDFNTALLFRIRFSL